MDYNLTICYSSEAENDLNNILDYISETLYNPSAAKSLYANIKNSLENVSLFPESCATIKNTLVKDSELRKLIVDNYIVFYKITDTEILVVRILYGMQNYKDIL